ncbi:MAG: carbon starvation protein A, partial [Endomicrobia bacterium]|nr:carbon starvation protein A [Endomicrobiia bacterium]
GPILAGVAFGWLPAILWIVLGTIFIGGLHDFSSLVISVRHEGRSIAEIVNKYVSKTAYKLFLLFIWLALMYVVAVFTDLAAESFTKEPSVAQISILYVIIAIFFGLLVYKIKISLSLSTVVALGLILIGIFLNLYYEFLFFEKQVWVWILLSYAFCASILPVWFLLQPRDYLSSYFLYFTVIVGLIGLIFGKHIVSSPAFVSFNSKDLGPLVPFIFITIACGAVSGFHSLVSSGTTSKQLDDIRNAKFVAYGGMILEGIVATVALSTLMIFPKGVNIANPQQVYATGIGKFCMLLGISENVGRTIGYLAISAFILTTLDTATRISRYIFQEFAGVRQASLVKRVVATIISLILPVLLLNLKLRDASGNVTSCWRIIWPLFGTTNQLLAALVLLTVYVWIKKQNSRSVINIFLPTLFMLFVTLFALIRITYAKVINRQFDIVTISAMCLLALAIYVVVECSKTVLRQRSFSS